MVYEPSNDVCRWLEELGLQQYAAVFQSTGISLTQLKAIQQEPALRAYLCIMCPSLPVGPRRKVILSLLAAHQTAAAAAGTTMLCGSAPATNSAHAHAFPTAAAAAACRQGNMVSQLPAFVADATTTSATAVAAGALTSGHAWRSAHASQLLPTRQAKSSSGGMMPHHAPPALPPGGPHTASPQPHHPAAPAHMQQQATYAAAHTPDAASLAAGQQWRPRMASAHAGSPLNAQHAFGGAGVGPSALSMHRLSHSQQHVGPGQDTHAAQSGVHTQSLLHAQAPGSTGGQRPTEAQNTPSIAQVQLHAHQPADTSINADVTTCLVLGMEERGSHRPMGQLSSPAHSHSGSGGGTMVPQPQQQLQQPRAMRPVSQAAAARAERLQAQILAHQQAAVALCKPYHLARLPQEQGLLRLLYPPAEWNAVQLIPPHAAWLAHAQQSLHAVPAHQQTAHDNQQRGQQRAERMQGCLQPDSWQASKGQAKDGCLERVSDDGTMERHYPKRLRTSFGAHSQGGPAMGGIGTSRHSRRVHMVQAACSQAPIPLHFEQLIEPLRLHLQATQLPMGVPVGVM